MGVDGSELEWMGVGGSGWEWVAVGGSGWEHGLVQPIVEQKGVWWCTFYSKIRSFYK